MEKFGNKINLSGCKWSNLNTLGTETPVSHSLLSDSLFPYFQPLLPPSVLPLFGVIRNWTSHFPSMKGRKVDNFWNKFRLTGCKWSNLNAPGTETPVSHSLLCESLFPISSPCCFLSSSLWGNKKWPLALASRCHNRAMFYSPHPFL